MFDVITEMTQFTLAYSNPSTTNNIKLVTHNTTRTGDPRSHALYIYEEYVHFGAKCAGSAALQLRTNLA